MLDPEFNKLASAYYACLCATGLTQLPIFRIDWSVRERRRAITHI